MGAITFKAYLCRLVSITFIRFPTRAMAFFSVFSSHFIFNRYTQGDRNRPCFTKQTINVQASGETTRDTIPSSACGLSSNLCSQPAISLPGQHKVMTLQDSSLQKKSLLSPHFSNDACPSTWLGYSCLQGRTRMEPFIITGRDRPSVMCAMACTR